MPSIHHSRLRGLAAADQKTREDVARRGGLTISRDRSYMAEIGRRGGEAHHTNRGRGSSGTESYDDEPSSLL
ncbi:MAG TPA: hypothetical protein VFQ60_00510 [Patescibacteria group bacterium]|nr:hypothetical protein [Patescibacteria group bacterium]